MQILLFLTPQNFSFLFWCTLRTILSLFSGCVAFFSLNFNTLFVLNISTMDVFLNIDFTLMQKFTKTVSEGKITVKIYTAKYRDTAHFQ